MHSCAADKLPSQVPNDPFKALAARVRVHYKAFFNSCGRHIHKSKRSASAPAPTSTGGTWTPGGRVARLRQHHALMSMADVTAEDATASAVCIEPFTSSTALRSDWYTTSWSRPAGHERNRLARVVAVGALTRQHHGVRAVKHGVGHICALADHHLLGQEHRLGRNLQGCHGQP